MMIALSYASVGSEPSPFNIVHCAPVPAFDKSNEIIPFVFTTNCAYMIP